MIITISGALGSGKSTVGTLLAGALRYEKMSTGSMMRELAAKRGMTIVEFNALCEKDPTIDKELDDYVAQIGRTRDKLVIDSRLAFFFIPTSFKVKLNVDMGEAARRIFADSSRTTERSYASVADAEKDIRYRRGQEVERFKGLYHVNIDDDTLFDLVIDTTHLTPVEVAQKIQDAVASVRA